MFLKQYNCHMTYESPKPPNHKLDKVAQIDLDFDGKLKEARLQEAANKYKIPDKTKIYEDAFGVFRFKATDKSAEEWDKERSTLDEKEKNDIYHHN